MNEVTMRLSPTRKELGALGKVVEYPDQRLLQLVRIATQDAIQRTHDQIEEQMNRLTLNLFHV
jgi:hypothetical protein